MKEYNADRPRDPVVDYFARLGTQFKQKLPDWMKR